MAWIKRNLIFFISLIVAVVLLALAVVYDLQSLGHNATAADKLKEIYDTLAKNSTGGKYSWGNEKINNIQTAKDQTAEILKWINKTGDYFAPITPIPNLPDVTSEAFANALRRTIDQLQHEADDASVELPPKSTTGPYAFSFEEQRSSTKFASGSLGRLAVQLGEVKTISEILFAARVNALDSVQRIRLSDDDTAGPQADYINDLPTTNSLAVLLPYAVTFRAFSGELAAVLSGFAASPHGFVVTGIAVSPAVQDAQADAGMNEMAARMTPPARVAVAGHGGLPTVLDERLLRVTLQIQIVKLSPRK